MYGHPLGWFTEINKVFLKFVFFAEPIMTYIVYITVLYFLQFTTFSTVHYF